MEALQPILYSRKLAANALSLSVRSLDYIISDGHLKTVRIGSKNLVPRTEILKFAKRGLPTAIRIDGDSE